MPSTPRCAHPAPGPHSKPGSPPGPFDPPGKKNPPPPVTEPKSHVLDPECCPKNLRESAIYPGLPSFHPEQTCIHGLHGAVTPT